MQGQAHRCSQAGAFLSFPSSSLGTQYREALLRRRRQQTRCKASHIGVPKPELGNKGDWRRSALPTVCAHLRSSACIRGSTWRHVGTALVVLTIAAALLSMNIVARGACVAGGTGLEVDGCEVSLAETNTALGVVTLRPCFCAAQAHSSSPARGWAGGFELVARHTAAERRKLNSRGL
jgi:hypothetical protein